IEQINITMGYPIAGTPLLSLIKLITEMEWEVRGIYYKRALPLLKHSYVKKTAKDSVHNILNLIVKENIIYAKRELFHENEFLKLLFSEIPEGDNSSALLCDKITAILDILSQSQGVNRIEKEFIYHIHTAITRVRGLLIPMTLKTFSRLLDMLIQGLTIPFRGEPLSGLQIMGVLETRALDFENIIICSVNEGLFPKKSISNSFIPYNLRIGFGLPVKEHEDALYSYLFYRLISRAKKVFLLYDTRTDGLKSGEASRFIMQLKYLYDLPVKERSVVYRVEPQVRREIVIEKDAAVMKKLGQFLQIESGKALSASALNTFIDCPLQFYFSYIEGVEIEEEISEELEASEFGSIFHFVMERLYKLYEGKILTRDLLKTILQDEHLIEREIDKGFLKYKNIINPKGYALLIKRLIIKYVQITLRYDITETPFEYLGAEKKLIRVISIKLGMDVPLKGFLDRIDKKEALRIVDYKTGKGDLSFRTIESLFDPSFNRRNKVAFQMYLYALLLEHRGELIAEPYFIRELAKGKSHRIFIDELQKDEFKLLLVDLLDKIFDQKIPFSATENSDICKWCDFNSICY
ncbi:MAG: PD-(D/E)XK nuclease family protein, partial [Bacteroidales bacterium]